jgi:hypothetical protein
LLLVLLVVLVANAAPIQTLFSGSTANNAPWQAEGQGSVSLDVQTRLSLTSVPTYLCRIVHRFSASSNSFFDFDPLTNVTGACTPRNPTANGFKVRLRYSDDRNLTVSKVSDWRVLWIAATNKHPGAEKPSSIEATANLIKQLINEEQAVVKGLLGSEYMPMLSNLPKPKPPPETGKNNKTAEANDTTSSTSAKSE